MRSIELSRRGLSHKMPATSQTCVRDVFWVRFGGEWSLPSRASMMFCNIAKHERYIAATLVYRGPAAGNLYILSIYTPEVFSTEAINHTPKPSLHPSPKFRVNTTLVDGRPAHLSKFAKARKYNIMRTDMSPKFESIRHILLSKERDNSLKFKRNANNIIIHHIVTFHMFLLGSLCLTRLIAGVHHIIIYTHTKIKLPC